MPVSVRGGGGNCYLGNAQIEVASYKKVLPLQSEGIDDFEVYIADVIFVASTTSGSKDSIALFTNSG